MSRVLIVDDMAVFREPIGAAMRLRGYEVAEVADGEAALAAMPSFRPDIVLLDVAMPRMDGMSVLRAMRADERFRATPVILLTAAADRDRVVEAARLGVRDYMLKSNFSLHDLHERIQRALAGPEAPEAEAGAPPAPPATAQPVAAPAPAAPAGARATGGPAAATAPALGGPTPIVGALPGDEADLKSLKPLLARSQVQEGIDAFTDLKALSPAVAQVLELARNPRCSIEQLTRAVRRDHAISLKILKLANSAIYTRGEPVDSVQKAILRIGMEQIAQTVTNIAVVEMFSESNEPRLSGPLFWEHSIATGLIAAEITRALGGREDAIDASFTMGLIHDVGRLVYAEGLGEVYTRVLDEADRLRLPLEQVESRLLLISHAEAMDRALHAWRFPKDLINPVAMHHLSVGNIRRMAPTSVQEASTLALANRIAHAMLVGSSGNNAIYPTEEFAEALRLPERLFDQLLEQVPEAATDIKIAMLARSPGSSPWATTLDEARNALPCPVRAVHASGAPKFDAFRLLFRRLARDAGDIAPNLGVVHLRDARERARVGSEFQKAEREAGVERLPLLIFSPSGALRLEDGVLAGRRITTLPSTVRLDLLLEAAGALLAGAEAQRASAA